MSKFTPEMIKERRMLRLAQLIFDHWEEGSGMHTRLFEMPLIHDSMVEKGKSIKGSEYREHVVPCAFIRDECIKLFDNNASIEAVKEKLMQNLWIVRISKDEAKLLDENHKVTMPEGWTFGDDPLARLVAAEIILVS